ncbi:HNH endonuclease [Burkholderia gladioli]|uniref:HNH endonuclease n=1 Tax=Burkholderia gladioli TaxID=28095 RepID=UPI003EE2DA4E
MAHKQSEKEVYKLVLAGELEIDMDGRIWRIAKRTHDRWTGGMKVTPCIRVRAEQKTTAGYLQVRAMIDGKRHYAAAARLVWLHFNGPIPQGLTANHKDGVKDRNNPANLELATYSEQRHHAIQALGAGHHDVRGSLHPKTKLTESQVMEIRRLRATGLMVKDIAQRFGISQNAASQICRNVTWRHVPNC